MVASAHPRLAHQDQIVEEAYGESKELQLVHLLFQSAPTALPPSMIITYMAEPVLHRRTEGQESRGSVNVMRMLDSTETWFLSRGGEARKNNPAKRNYISFMGQIILGNRGENSVHCTNRILVLK